MLIRSALVDISFDPLATSNRIYRKHNHGAPNKDKVLTVSDSDTKQPTATLRLESS